MKYKIEMLIFVVYLYLSQRQCCCSEHLEIKLLFKCNVLKGFIIVNLFIQLYLLLIRINTTNKD